MRRALQSQDSTARRAAHSHDSLYAGTLRFQQPTEDYRVNADTLLLAEAVARNRTRIGRLVDLGAGVGALALCIRHLTEVARVDLVERDEARARLADRNLGQNGAQGVVHVHELTRAGPPAELVGVADVVVSNPPFFERAQARPRRVEERDARRGPLAPFLRAASRCLGRRGAAFFVYPAQSLAALLGAAADSHLHAKRLRFVHAFADRPARIALIELRRAKPGGLVVEPPLVEWTAPGVKTAELEAILGRPRADRTR
jgi:tRNA1(Val) A37 N6-methylase TrmN6